MNCRPPLGSNTPHIVGVIAGALILAGPLARAQSPGPSGVESSVQAEAPAPEQSGSPAPKDSGFIPGVLIGPRLSVAVPTPTIGVEAKVLRYLGFAFDYGLSPKLDISGVSVSYEMWDVAVRVYPFGHTFFVGAVYGHYGVEAVGSTPQGSGSVRASSNFLGPQIGARWIQPSGFFFGIDLAWAFPLGYSSEASPDPSGTTVSVKQTADRYLQNGIPVAGLISVGWLF
ncbi:MAG: hypothetical protein ACXWK4_08300 [Myxococcaceae bacterium]